MKLGKWGIYLDIWPFEEDCREYGAPSRIYIRTPRKHITVKTGLPYRVFELLYRFSYENPAGAQVKVYEPLGRTWEWERPGIQVREQTWSPQG